LEVIGSLLRVYVDDKRVLEARDSAHAHGQVGLMTYKTAADYDNVIVSTQQLLPLLADDFATSYPNRWQAEGGTWAQANAPQWVYEQSSLAGTARAITGVTTQDQMVQALVKPTVFASGTERWFGLIARYVDVSNYYYVTLRTNNTISLRKLVNGTIQELDSAPLQVTAGTPYRLRLDAIGSTLHVYVNGSHVLEATDATFASGKYGLATYKTGAQFDDFLASQP
jgi:pectate lyase